MAGQAVFGDCVAPTRVGLEASAQAALRLNLESTLSSLSGNT